VYACIISALFKCHFSCVDVVVAMYVLENDFFKLCELVFHFCSFPFIVYLFRQATMALTQWEKAQAALNKNNNSSKSHSNKRSKNFEEEEDKSDEDKNDLLSMLKSFSQVWLNKCCLLLCCGCLLMLCFCAVVETD